MNKTLQRIAIILVLGISAFLIHDWWQDRIEFKREKISNGWFKYSNDKVEFEYPNKLRNCTECSVNTGNIYKIMTDGDYIIMTMYNQNSSYLINPNRNFAYPKNNKTSEIRMELDSILLKNNINPTDSFINKNLKIQEILLNPDSNTMKYDMSLLGKQVAVEINSDELKDCGSESWNFWKLKREGDNITKLVFGLDDGRFFSSEGEENVFFEIQKIKRRNFYAHKKGNLSEKEIAKFFNSIKIKQ